ncbi:MAG: DUF2726 domain-containing protein [Burkholderiales bacterium]
MLTALLWLSPFVAIAVIVWNYRRKTAAREAASNERLKEIFSKSAGEGAADALPATSATAVSAPASAIPASAPSAPVRPSMQFALRERLLAPPQTLLYYLLKSSLSDHEVLAQVSVATLIDVPTGVSGFEREARQRRLTAAVIDFVVCDKSFKAVAVVQCVVSEGSAAETMAYARTCCESAGLRWVEMAPDALPRREAMRTVVLGGLRV